MSARQINRASAWALYWALVRQDLQLRVLGSMLGMLWLVLQPLLYLSFTTVVFYYVLGVRFADGAVGSYVLFLLTGLVAWLGVNEGIGKAAPTLIDRANLIRNFPIPRVLVPLVPLIAALAYQGVCLLALILATAARGELGSQVLMLVPALLLEALLLAGIAWLVAAGTVLYRDIQYLLAFALMAWLYLTPIFYPAGQVPPPLDLVVVHTNPLAMLVIIFRGAILGTQVAFNVWGTLAFISLAMFALGLIAFRRVEHALGDLL